MSVACKLLYENFKYKYASKEMLWWNENSTLFPHFSNKDCDKKKKRLPKLIGGIAVELSHWVHPVGILKAVIGTVTVEERRHSLQCTEQRSGQLAPHFQVFWGVSCEGSSYGLKLGWEAHIQPGWLVAFMAILSLVSNAVGEFLW